MKNKFFAKLLMIALIICSATLITACSTYQKQVNIKSIEIDVDNMPDYIRVGEFDNANIQLIINYDDDTKETVKVTKDFIPEKYHDYLETPGVYEIAILFKGKTVPLNIRIVGVDVYVVEFYNGQELLIDRQFISEGEDAIAPSSETYSMAGYEFIGWDRLFTDVSEDIKVYGLYSKISEEGTNDAVIRGKMANAFTYMYTHNNVVVASPDAYLIYHYDPITQEPSSQAINLNDAGEIRYVSYTTMERRIEMEYIDDEDRENGWTIEDQDDYTGLEMDQIKFFILTGGFDLSIFTDESEWTYSYILSGNRNLYTIEISYQGADFTRVTTFVFDDEKILNYSINYKQAGHEDALTNLLVEYKDVEFEKIESVDTDTFLKFYNDAFNNTLEQTLLSIQKVEALSDITYNVKDNKGYYTNITEESSFQQWIQKDGDQWRKYNLTQDNHQSYVFTLESDNVVRDALEFAQLTPMDNSDIVEGGMSTSCVFNQYRIELTATTQDGFNLELTMSYDGLIEGVVISSEYEESYLFSYSPDEVEMVELPDLDWGN